MFCTSIIQPKNYKLKHEWSIWNVLFLKFGENGMFFFKCAQNGMCSKWIVLFLKCAVLGICCFWNVYKMEFVLFGMCCFWMCTKWNVLFLECASFGMSSFCNVLFVDWAQNGILCNLIFLIGTLRFYKNSRHTLEV